MFKRLQILLVQRLFWKVFLWFWLAMIVMIFSVAITILVSLDPDALREERQHLLANLDHAAQRMERFALHQRGRHSPPGRPPVFISFPENNERIKERLAKVLVRMNEAPLLDHYLFSVSGESLLPHSPPEVSQFMARYGTHTEPVIRRVEGRLLVGPRLMDLRGEQYQLVMSMEPPWLGARILFASSTHLSVVFIAIVVSGLFSGLMSASLIRPLRHLQLAAQRIAGGDLSSRAGEPLVQRRDEVGDLGRDFDRMADQLERLVSGQQRLLRDVSHELRSPLTRLQISLALARNKSEGLIDAQLDRSEREIQRLNQLIGQVIEWSRIDSSHQAGQPTDLDALIQSVVEDCNFEAQARGCSVVLSGPSLGSIEGDGEALRSALENIIRNAIRFSPEAGQIEVNTRVTGTLIEIDIEDQGPGVPEEALEAMFQPFYRVDETRGEENSGSGLGTAIARRAIERHGGTIVASNRQPGLCVRVSLPYRR
ncbi:ATP-binding protein [Aestuariirhabdus sp. Z084]|uniref:ATP-binding protein n=1 Tax=Aestuariirhabdus haliotis TaxID=2918751 RepID=UPI00201B37D5|nr:ATP-binding protein [Aestuariirhabdus haliotis]MCL6415988.1 ATP-binding protein [Aestuariirhabdus haliotis]MCL6419979.1 ATP-binding protein [Aestuariirhabdus haliotis]